MVKDASHHFPEEIPDTYLSILVPWLLDCEARSETLKAS
ncbi:hypothetical protein Rhow_008554 [Rhodococcus wratislaviensis]|uniref:Uncharacterized protein n=2 Tax=Rhodococcus wratislaviensis TaxID=44752 RepID=A0A402CKS2_RHOWR|nr:hypothetical protein Rhow_008554 [Rhodococcus wratislaviensis]